MEFHEIEFRIPFVMENDFIRNRCKMWGSNFCARAYTLEELSKALRLAKEIVKKQVSMVSP